MDKFSIIRNKVKIILEENSLDNKNEISLDDLRRFIIQAEELNEDNFNVDSYEMNRKVKELQSIPEKTLLSWGKHWLMIYPSMAKAYKFDENTTIEPNADWPIW